jgi:selenide, water dikinase
VAEPEVRLTALSQDAGSARKLSPAELHLLLAELPAPHDPALLVGLDTADDAAVYRVSGETAIVSTADFFAPVVDDPFDFGRIAAADAFSDVYAMGATPLTALNLVAYPLDELGPDVLRQILRGGAEVAREAGVAIAGGHTIDERGLKYGMAVTGTVHPDRLLRNSTAGAGDELYLSKPVGAGIVSTAVKRGLEVAELVDRAVEVMTALNREASLEALDARASAATDVSGFGLLGHLHEMVAASGVAAEVEAESVPALEGVLYLLRSPEPPIAAGTRLNREWLGEWVRWCDDVPEERRWLLCDAMTSGGLLVAAPPHSGAPGACIGRIVDGEPGRIAVRRR